MEFEFCTAEQGHENKNSRTCHMIVDAQSKHIKFTVLKYRVYLKSKYPPRAYVVLKDGPQMLYIVGKLVKRARRKICDCGEKSRNNSDLLCS